MSEIIEKPSANRIKRGLQKPLIIINCSGEKNKSACQPIDLYNHRNSLATIIRSKSDILDGYLSDMNPGFWGKFVPPRFRDIADVFILSAEHGLIDAYGDEIEPYDTEMPKSDEGFAMYVSKHKTKARRIFKKAVAEEREVYVCLINEYKNALEKMVGSQLKDVQRLYVSEGHCGIGDLRGRLSKICNLVAYDWAVWSGKYHRLEWSNPISFRSGCGSAEEIQVYSRNGVNVGTSLHYINTSKPERHIKLLGLIAKSNKRSNKVFLDNGFISNKNLKIDWVLDEYLKISESYFGGSANSNLSIVLPDSLDPNGAIDILRNYKDRISQLLKLRLRVILPIHNWGSNKFMRSHISEMLEVLGWPENLVLGVPCLPKRVYSFSKLQSIMSLKNPNGDNAFSRVHFLGASSVGTRSKAYHRRCMIAEIFGFKDVTFDSNRANALWGNKEENERAGTKLETILDDELLKVPSERKVFTRDFTESYDLKLMKSLLNDKIDDFNWLTISTIMNRHLPESMKLDLSYIAKSSEPAKVFKKIYPKFWDRTLIHLSRNVLKDAQDAGLIKYDASNELNYYDKRQVCYGALGER